MCYTESATKKSSDDGNAKHGDFYDGSKDLLYFALISGAVAAICMTFVLCLLFQCKKIKIKQDEKFRTMYHRVNDTIDRDDPEIARVINKGL